MPLPIDLALDVARDPFVALRRPARDGVAGAPLLLERAAGWALPIWSSVAAAEAFAAAAAEADLETVAIEADDLRGKEELLVDALELGAALVLHDPDAASGSASGHDLAQRARNELLAERRASACL